MSSTAIIWTVTVMGCLWAPLCRFTWKVEIEGSSLPLTEDKDNSKEESE